MPQYSLTSFIGGRRPWERAEARIREFMEVFRPRYLYVMFSGGKDSAAVLGAARRVTGRVVGVFLHIPGQTHEESVRAAMEASRALGMPFVRLGVARRGELGKMVARAIEEYGMPLVLHIITPDYYRSVPFWEAVRIYGMPMPLERVGGRKRWCCAHFKSEWMAELPPNMVVEGRPARAVATGLRMEESAYRRKAWEGVGEPPFKVFRTRGGVMEYNLAPIIDLTTQEVIDMLRHYGIAEAILPQYERWQRSPTCMLCPMMGKRALRTALANLPTQYLTYVKQVLEEILPRYREGTRTKRLIRDWISMIEEELRRREAGGETAATRTK